MSHRIAVLGGGLVGGFIARRLARENDVEVTLWDRDESALSRSRERAAVATRVGDLASEEVIRSAVEAADLVVGAVPGHMGYETLRSVLRVGRDVVDISFFPEDAWSLRDEAAESRARVVVDCGVMPGLGGMLGIHMARRLDDARSLSILVGGLPCERRWPTEYKAPFSPSDVIEEYTRPARYRVAGQLVTEPALSGRELVDLPGVGTLEAFATDGLRTLLQTLDLPDMVEKTLRYPGHADRMAMLRELGFFDERPLEFEGGRVSPLELTSRLLFDEWRLEPGMDELTVMRVEVKGLRSGKQTTLRADLFDRRDAGTDEFSMARTTGLPAALTALAILRGGGPPAGLLPGECLAEHDALFNLLLAGLREEGISIEMSEHAG